MNKSRPAAAPVDMSDDRSPGKKALTQKAAPLAAKAGSGEGESKPDSQSAKTDGEKAGHVKKPQFRK